jgi:hypothetical protein
VGSDPKQSLVIHAIHFIHIAENIESRSITAVPNGIRTTIGKGQLIDKFDAVFLFLPLTLFLTIFTIVHRQRNLLEPCQVKPFTGLTERFLLRQGSAKRLQA